MKSKTMLLGIFFVWFLLVITCFLIYTLTYDPFFGSPRNIPYRYQPRGNILDRNGKGLAVGTPRKYPLGAAGEPIVGMANPEIGTEGHLERKYSEKLITNKSTKLWYLFNQNRNGYPLNTTIDKDLQLAAYRAMKGNNGAIVILLLNGEVLVSVSKPSFDPNKMTRELYSDLLKNSDRPLFNRAFDGRYEPGSVWKAVIAIMLLEKHSKGNPAICEGRIKVGNKVIGCTKPHGLVNDMTEAFTASCNTWFIKNTLSELQPEELRAGFKKYMAHEMKKDMSLEDIAFSAIGQGEVLVSPLELAQLAAAIGNRGMKPESLLLKNHMVSVRVMKGETAVKLSEMMVGVVKRGTAKGLSDFARKGFFVSAKTGTSEKASSNGGKINTALITGLAGPSRANPEIAFSVVIEDTKDYGGTVCVPIIKEILEFYFSKSKGNGTLR